VSCENARAKHQHQDQADVGWQLYQISKYTEVRAVETEQR